MSRYRIIHFEEMYYALLHFEWADQRKHCANICHMAQVKW